MKNEFFAYNGEFLLWISKQPEVTEREEYDRKRMRIRIQYMIQEDGAYRLQFRFITSRTFSKGVLSKVSDPLKRVVNAELLKKCLEKSYSELATLANTRPGEYFLAAHAMNKSIQEKKATIRLSKTDFDKGYYMLEFQTEAAFPKTALITILRDLDRLTYINYKQAINGEGAVRNASGDQAGRGGK